MSKKGANSKKVNMFHYGWHSVRALAGLKILTKGSYVMLILVPVVATVWPALHAFLNSYNQTLGRSTVLMNDLSDQLGDVLIRFELDSGLAGNDLLQKSIGEFNSTITPISQGLVDLEVADTNLPGVWVLGFLGALLVFFAHLIYQYYVPEIIEKQKLSEYVNENIDDFERFPSALKLGKYGKIVMDTDPRLLSHLYSKKNMKEESEPDNSKEDVLKLELELVELASRMIYSQRNKSKHIAARICGLLYFGAICALLNITYSQTVNVLVSAGWL